MLRDKKGKGGFIIRSVNKRKNSGSPLGAKNLSLLLSRVIGKGQNHGPQRMGFQTSRRSIGQGFKPELALRSRNKAVASVPFQET
jgi:hypothetical protein